MQARSAPGLNTATTFMQRGSNFQRVSEIETLSTKWVEANKPERDRLFDNLKAFFAIYGGAWTDAALKDLKRQGRHAVSINISEQKLRTLAGSIQSEKWDFNFEPMNVDENSLTRDIKYYYYADKEQNNYGHSENKTLLRGLIHSGYEEIDIAYDIRKTGSIVFLPGLPGMVIPDPFWQDDILKNWRRAIKHAWLSPREIQEKYDTDDPYIAELARQEDPQGESYERNENVDMYEDVPANRGSKKLVIEYRELKKLKTTRLHAKLPNGSYYAFPLNVTKDQVQRFVKQQGISYEDTKEYPYEDDLLEVETICPTASRVAILSKGKHRVQCGFIGFFPFSAAREMGINKGVMESLLDVQRMLNYRESKKEDVIATMAAGATAVDIDALENKKKDLDNIKKNKTRPDFVLGVHGDPNKVMAKFPTGEVPQSIWNDIAGLIDLFDRVSPVTPALEGQASADESGVLFEMRHAVTKLGTLILYDNWRQHLMNKAEAWYNQALISYKDMYWKVKRTDGPGFVEFNSPVYDGDRKGYENQIADLPRSRVIVTLSKFSPTEQYSKRLMLYDMTKIFSAHPELFKQQIRVVNDLLVGTLELSTEDREVYKRISTLQQQNDMLELMTHRETLIASGLQAKLTQGQIMQMIQQLQAELGATMGGGQGQGGQPNVPRAISYDEGRPELPPAEITEPEGAGLELQPGAEVETSRGVFVP